MNQEKKPVSSRQKHQVCGIYESDQLWSRQSQALATRLGLQRVHRIPVPGSVLMFSGNGLALLTTNARGAQMVVRVDFTTRKWQRRIAVVRQEQLIKAMGRKPDLTSRIVDATGGLGRDSFLLAAAGFRVQVFERNPLLAALLEDGLLRAEESGKTKDICSRISLTCGDARCFLDRRQQVEIVYLDPLFPEQKKSAKVKKQLQVIRKIAGEDNVLDGLLGAAIKTATGRVVVKRPLHGPHLDNQPPSYTLAGKTVRFDIYLPPLKK